MRCSLLAYAALLAHLVVWAQQPAANGTHDSQHPSTAQSPASSEEIWSDLIAGNRRFVAGKPMARDLPALRDSLAKSQHPRVVVLSCSDSRVGPELLFDQNLGDLFVVRSAGNIADAIGLGSIEYAVDHLGSSVLVVLGHTKCGAVAAACSGDKMPTTNLQAIVDKIGPAVAKAAAVAKGEELMEAAIKQNIHQSAQDVLANSQMLRKFVAQGKLTIFEAEYRLETGEVIRLDHIQSAAKSH